MGALTTWPWTAGAAAATGAAGGGGGRRRRDGHGFRLMVGHRLHRLRELDDADLALALGDLEFGDAGLRHQVDQGLEFSEIHRVLPGMLTTGGHAAAPYWISVLL